LNRRIAGSEARTGLSFAFHVALQAKSIILVPIDKLRVTRSRYKHSMIDVPYDAITAYMIDA
jgi:hypothetical protein